MIQAREVGGLHECGGWGHKWTNKVRQWDYGKKESEWHLCAGGCFLWRGELTWEEELGRVGLFRTSLLKVWTRTNSSGLLSELVRNTDARGPIQLTTVKFKGLSLIHHLVHCQCWPPSFSLALLSTQLNLAGISGKFKPCSIKIWKQRSLGFRVLWRLWIFIQTLIHTDSFLGERTHSKVKAYKMNEIEKQKNREN